MATDIQTPDIRTPVVDPIGEINKYDFRNEERYIFKARKGLNREVVAEISEMKREPAWMLEFRLKALDIFYSKPMPRWGGNIAINFDDIYYYMKPTSGQVKSWDEVPEEIKSTFDKLGIPEAEKNSSPVLRLNTRVKWFTARSRKNFPSRA
jgi:Fe-S cluster assembly protein SufB